MIPDNKTYIIISSIYVFIRIQSTKWRLQYWGENLRYVWRSHRCMTWKALASRCTFQVLLRSYSGSGKAPPCCRKSSTLARRWTCRAFYGLVWGIPINGKKKKNYKMNTIPTMHKKAIGLRKQSSTRLAWCPYLDDVSQMFHEVPLCRNYFINNVGANLVVR